MVRRSDQEKVRHMPRDTIMLLCKNGLAFKSKFTIEAVIGVTVDDSDVFLLSMNEIVNAVLQDKNSDVYSSEEEVETSSARRNCKRKRRSNSRGHDSDVSNVSDGEYIMEKVTPEKLYVVDSSNMGQPFSQVEEGLEMEEEEADDDIVFVKEEQDIVHSPQNEINFLDTYAGMNTSRNNMAYQSQSDMNLTPARSHPAPIWQSMSAPPLPYIPPISLSANHLNKPIVVTPSGPESLSSPKPAKSKSQQSSPFSLNRSYSARFECSYCHKSFGEKWYMRTHENTHRGIYPYYCPICAKGLLTTQHMKAHIKKHSDVEQMQSYCYACMKCNRKFTNSEALTKHVEICIKDDSYAARDSFNPVILNTTSEADIMKTMYEESAENSYTNDKTNTNEEVGGMGISFEVGTTGVSDAGPIPAFQPTSDEPELKPETADIPDSIKGQDDLIGEVAGDEITPNDNLTEDQICVDAAGEADNIEANGSSSEISKVTNSEDNDMEINLGQLLKLTTPIPLKP